MSHGSNQRILEILGARLGKDELSDDEVQETNQNMQNNSSKIKEEDDSSIIRDKQQELDHIAIIQINQ